MSKTFRPWDVDQVWLLPPSIQDLVPAGHVAHFVRDTVRDALDLSRIMATYDEDRGYPPYHPGMMTALLLYGYSQGVYSSRRIARGCEERLDFAAVTGMQRPDFRTISDFRKRHLPALSGLFVQVLALCREAGLAKLGHVALDGTKLKANASKHKAMSYGRMLPAEAKLQAEVAAWLQQAAARDAAEDREHGPARRGDETPAWVADRVRRLAKIREAKAALEAQARAAAAAVRQDEPDDGDAAGKPGRQPKPPSGVPDDKAQRNFTDPESRIMKTKDGFVQGYNAQAAVDAASQVIVAHDLSQASNDKQQLAPMLEAIHAVNGRDPAQLSADAGYCSEDNLALIEQRSIDGYIAVGRQKHGTPAATGETTAKPGTRTQAMQEKLRQGGFAGPYRLRKQVVEPVFGQIKQARGFRQFLLRGLDQVKAEWALLCTVHNLLKLRTLFQPATSG
ncbi:MAG: IS1182 family transposase [Proteobacteria bacterium]|nr:IS1182 family transposase [Pseudomonadota bacterium]